MSRLFNGNVGCYLYTRPSIVYDNLQEITVGMWIYANSDNQTGCELIVKDPDNVYVDYVLVTNSPGRMELQFGVNDPSASSITGPSGTYSVVSKQWLYITFTYSASGDKYIHVYQNGVEVSYFSTSVGSGILAGDDSSGGFYIGSDSLDGGSSFDGYISNIAIWNRALTPSQVYSLYINGGGRPSLTDPNLVSYWPLYGLEYPEVDSVNGNNAFPGPMPPASGDIGPPGVTTVTPTLPTTLAPDSVDLLATKDLDVLRLQQFDLEYFYRTFPQLQWIRIGQKGSHMHSIYHESTDDQKSFESPVLLPIHVRVNPPMQILQKYGIDEPQDALGVFSLPVIGDVSKRLNLPSLQVSIGDRVQFFDSDFTFEINTVKMRDFVGATQTPLHNVVTLKNLPRK